MDKRPSRQEIRAKFAAARALWNEFSPIGAPDMPEDEYDSYVGPSLSMAAAHKSEDEFRKYVSEVVYERMGLNKTDQFEIAIQRFAKRFLDWYRTC